MATHPPPSHQLSAYRGNINAVDDYAWKKTNPVLLGLETVEKIYCCVKDLSFCDTVLGYCCCPIFCPLYFACGCLQPDPAFNDANPTKGCTALDRACNADNADVVQFLLAQQSIQPKQVRVWWGWWVRSQISASHGHSHAHIPSRTPTVRVSLAALVG